MDKFKEQVDYEHRKCNFFLPSNAFPFFIGMARVHVGQLQVHFRADCHVEAPSLPLTRSRDAKHGGADKEFCIRCT